MSVVKRVREILGFLLIVVAINGQAGVIEVEARAEGYGASKELALRDALSKAVGQVTGLEISTNSSIVTGVLRAEVSVDGQPTESASLSYTQSESSQTKVDGTIKNYRVLGFSTDSDGMYIAKVLATVYTYEQDASSQRKKIALLPVENNFSTTSAGRKLAMKVGQDIEAELVQTRRFAVLSRTDIDKVMGEQRFITSDAVHKSERAKLGNLLGGDVLLSVTIEKGYISTKEKVIKLTGQVKRTTTGELKINAKVISAVTGEVKFSETYSNTYGDRLGNLDAMSKDIAAKAVKDLTNRIYPPLVISVKGNSVVLNVGGKGVQKGALYTVYSQGESLVDPYTGESLGSVEEEMGTIKLTRVESKFSVGQVVSGGDFAPGMVARFKSSAKSTAKSAKKTSTRAEPAKPEGGVKLPFD